MADDAGHAGRLATIDSDAIIAEIGGGALTKDIAARYGVSKQALQKRLADHPDYEKAIETQCETLLEKAAEPYFNPEQFEGLTDSVVIARTRDRMRAAEVYAKVICPNRFNAKPTNVNIINNVVNIDQALTGDAANLLDKLRTVVVQHDATQQNGQIAQEIGNNDASD